MSAVRDPPRTSIDGLIEGPLPPFPDGEARLRGWVEFARGCGLVFQLAMEGGSFSLLVDREPLVPGRITDIRSTMEQAMEQLLSIFPRDLRGRIFSTVRSTEYLAEERIETVYLVTSQGVNVRERRVPAEAIPERPPLSRRIPAAWIAVGACVLVAAIVALALRIDLVAFLRGKIDPYLAIDPAAIEIDAAAVARYVTMTKLGVDSTGARLDVEARRTPEFPRDFAAYSAEEGRLAAAGDLRGLIALRKVVVDGTVRLTYVGPSGSTLATEEESVRGLLDGDSVRLALPVKEHPGTVKIVVGF